MILRFVITGGSTFLELPDEERAQMVKSMTVGTLREKLEGVPDDAKIFFAMGGRGYSVSYAQLK